MKKEFASVLSEKSSKTRTFGLISYENLFVGEKLKKSGMPFKVHLPIFPSSFPLVLSTCRSRYGYVLRQQLRVS